MTKDTPAPRTVPEQRRTVRADALTLHRIRDTHFVMAFHAVGKIALAGHDSPCVSLLRVSTFDRPVIGQPGCK
jgi:hypothetical protein